MTAQNYLEQVLENLKNPTEKSIGNQNINGEIVRLLLSKKFRKYSITDEVRDHVIDCVNYSVENNQPIAITMPYGAYKIWRLDESPEVDWAELFTLIHLVKWLKPICEIYKPGVWFDFFSDEIIVPRLDNYPEEDMRIYEKGHQELINFIRFYQPENLKISVTRVRDRYSSLDEFEKDLENQKVLLNKKLGGKLPNLSEDQVKNLEFNVKLSEEQKADPLWKEKVQFLHDSYAAVSKRRPYYRDPEMHKIMAFPAPINGAIAVGSTKDSVTKFWTGCGVLLPRKDEFRMIVLSPERLKVTNYHFETIGIGPLKGRNFSKIKVIDS